MAGARTSGSTTRARGPRGAAGPRAKATPRGGWSFVDLSDPDAKASYERQLTTRGKDVGQGLEQVRRMQRSQAGSGGFASDEEPEGPPSATGEGSSPLPGKPAGLSLPSLPAPTLRPPSKLSASDGGGFVLGLFLFTIGQAYLRYGPSGVTGWFAAKFLNRPNASIVAAEAKRGITAKAHGQLTTPGQPSTPPVKTPAVPPGGRYGR